MGKIISCFSCTGKTHFVLNNFKRIDCIDHDIYDWQYRGGLGNKWQELYLERMNDLVKKFDIVFVNALPFIIDKLPSDSIVVYPGRFMFEEWIHRAKERGSVYFADILEREWYRWIEHCSHWSGEKIVMSKGQYLSDVLKL